MSFDQIRCPKCGGYVDPSVLLGNGRHCPHCQAALPATPEYGSGKEYETQETIEYSGSGTAKSAGRTHGGHEPTLTDHCIGRFQLKEKLGQGAFGVVYRAYDPNLDRDVAVKVPNFVAATKSKIERFLREAKAAARLRHPNIVAVFESGKVNDQYFIAAEFVDGETLASRMKSCRPSLKTSVAWIRDLARALQYAHVEGVVHRDIKPANIMIDAADHPQLLDFGLAKREAEDSDVTKDGSIIGTPSYMSPEQARAERDVVGPASDQYSLATVLYELLAGARPYDGASHSVIALVANTDVEPPRPRKLNPEIPVDLEACLLKSLEKEIPRRYESMEEYAEDLDRWLQGTPVTARPITRAERCWRWCKRNKALASLISVVAALLIVGSITATIAAFQFAAVAQREKKAAEEEADARIAAELTVADQLASAGVVAGERGNHARAVMLFATAARQAKHDPQSVQYNRIRLRNWSRNVARPVQAFPHEGEKIRSLHFHPSGEYLLVLTQVDRLEIWQLKNGRQLPLPSDSNKVHWAAFSPHGDRLAIAQSESQKITVWSFPNLEEEQTISHTSTISQASFDPTGKWLAIGGKTARVWDLSQKEFATTELNHPEVIEHLAFSQRGDRLVTACQGTARVFSITGEAEGNQPLFDPVPHLRTVAPIFLDGGRELLTLASDKEIVLWDATSGERLGGMQTQYGIGVMEPSLDGRFVAVCDFKSARLWDVETRSQLGALMAHKNYIYSAAFTSYGESLWTTSSDRYAAAWRVPTGKPTELVIPHQNEVTKIAVAADGQHVATAEDRGLVRVWKVDLDHRSQTVKIGASETFLKPSPTRKHVMAAGWDVDRELTEARVYDTATGRTVAEFKVAGLLNGGAISPDEEHVVTLSSLAKNAGQNRPSAQELAEQPGEIQFWDLSSKKKTHGPITTPSEPIDVVYDSTGALAAVVCFGGEVLVIDTQTGAERWRQSHDAWARIRYLQHRRVAFSPDASKVVTWGFGTSVHVWDSQDGSVLYKLSDVANHVLYDVQFSSDGRWMATSADQTTDAVSIWDVKTGSLKKRLPHPDWVLTAKFSPDDKMILTACRDRIARLWNWQSGKLVCAGFQHDDSVLSANFVRNGEFIFTCSRDQTGRFWEYKSGKALSPPIRFEGIPYQSITTQFGDQVLVSGRMSEIFFLSVDDWLQPAPATDSFCMERWGEILAGESVIQGGTVAFTSDEWLQRWNDHKTNSSTHRPAEGPR